MTKKPQNKRAPAAFDLDAEAAPKADEKPEPKSKSKPALKPEAPRKARALPVAKVRIEEEDFFDSLLEEAATEPPPPPKKRSFVGRMFLAGISILITSAFALWTDQLIRDLFTRADWLGWVAIAAAAMAALALLIFITREISAIWSQNAVAKLQDALQSAHDLNSDQDARKAVRALQSHTSALAPAAKGQAELKAIEETIMDGKDRIIFAERELLSVLDSQAIALVKASAQRVSVVTAVSPRAIVDISYVIIENMRLMRRLSLHYGGKPGTLGMFRLARSVVGHLAVTGSIAVGDTIIQQLVGQGLAARLSARLGEGVVNGLMTVRVGIAAIEVTRPAPFIGQTAPKVRDFARILSKSAEADA